MRTKISAIAKALERELALDATESLETADLRGSGPDSDSVN